MCACVHHFIDMNFVCCRQKFGVDEPSDGAGEEAVDCGVMARSDIINLSSCSVSEVPKK